MGQKRKGLSPSWEIEPLPSHPRRPASFDIPLEDPDVGPAPIMDPEKDYHPTDMSEGLLEKLIKYAGNKGTNFKDNDNMYLEQYLHPERDIIPKQPLRPSGLSETPNIPFRRLPERMDRNTEDGPEGPDYYPNVIGLGNTTARKGKDYNSIYDVWDFDTTANLFGSKAERSVLGQAGNWVAKKIMQNIGQPYAVYERYPQDFKPDDFEFQDPVDVRNTKKKNEQFQGKQR